MERVCFVCMEPCEQPCKCKCVDRHAHPECLLKWLQPKQTTRCDVCREEYANARIETTISKGISRAFVAIVAGAVWFVGLFSAGILCVNGGAGARLSGARFSFAAGIVMLFVSSFGLSACLIGGAEFYRGGCHFWQNVDAPRVVMSA